MDLIKLTGSVSVSRSLFRLPPGMIALNLQHRYLQISCSSVLVMAVSWVSDRKRLQLLKFELCIA